MKHLLNFKLFEGFFDNIKSKKDLKKSYRELSKKMHPDKGGNAEEFKKMQNEYDKLKNLSDEELFDRKEEHSDNRNSNHAGCSHGRCSDEMYNSFNKYLNELYEFEEEQERHQSEDFGVGSVFYGPSIPEDKLDRMMSYDDYDEEYGNKERKDEYFEKIKKGLTEKIDLLRRKKKKNNLENQEIKVILFENIFSENPYENYKTFLEDIMVNMFKLLELSENKNELINWFLSIKKDGKMFKLKLFEKIKFIGKDKKIIDDTINEKNIPYVFLDLDIDNYFIDTYYQILIYYAKTDEQIKKIEEKWGKKLIYNAFLTLLPSWKQRRFFLLKKESDIIEYIKSTEFKGPEYYGFILEWIYINKKSLIPKIQPLMIKSVGKNLDYKDIKFITFGTNEQDYDDDEDWQTYHYYFEPDLQVKKEIIKEIIELDKIDELGTEMAEYGFWESHEEEENLELIKYMMSLDKNCVLLKLGLRGYLYHTEYFKDIFNKYSNEFILKNMFNNDIIEALNFMGDNFEKKYNIFWNYLLKMIETQKADLDEVAYVFSHQRATLLQGIWKNPFINIIQYYGVLKDIKIDKNEWKKRGGNDNLLRKILSYKIDSKSNYIPLYAYLLSDNKKEILNIILQNNKEAAKEFFSKFRNLKNINLPSISKEEFDMYYNAVMTTDKIHERYIMKYLKNRKV
jgi:curved DNA-binding protein CbpA